MKTIPIHAAKVTFENLLKIRSANSEGIEQIYQFLRDSIVSLNEALIDLLGEQEFLIDPDLLLEHLLNYQYLASGLQGLAIALHRKISVDRSFLDEGPDGKKIAQTARERMGKGAAADLEGLIEAIKGMLTNLYERIEIQRGKHRKSYG